ncbi:MAG: hypothetical protein ACR2KG_07535 [Nocardioidaceae bacterium]
MSAIARWLPAPADLDAASHAAPGMVLMGHTPRSIERNTTAYLAREILDLVTIAERRLSSTRFDTSAAPPNSAVPARPESRKAPHD